MDAAKIYPRQFQDRGHGHGHWRPEDEMQLGDVGFYHRTNGNFHRLCNILVPANHPLNSSKGVPPSFVPFSLNPDLVEFTNEYLLPQPVVSSSVVSVHASVGGSGSPAANIGAGMTYKCFNEQGAVLLFGSRMARADICDNYFLEGYVERNVDSWYDLANRCGFSPKQAPEGSLVLIRGCDKAPSYVLAAFCKQKKEAIISFQGGFVKSGDIRLRLEGSWEKTDSAQYRSGAPKQFPQDQDPTVPPTNEHGRPDFPFFAPDCIYTLFSRIYTITRKKFGLRIPVKLEAAAGPDQLPRGDFDGDASAAAPVEDEDCKTELESDQTFKSHLAQGTDYGAHPLDDVADYDTHPYDDIATAAEDDQEPPIDTDDPMDGKGVSYSPKVDIRERAGGRTRVYTKTAESEASGPPSVHSILQQPFRRDTNFVLIRDLLESNLRTETTHDILQEIYGDLWLELLKEVTAYMNIETSGMIESASHQSEHSAVEGSVQVQQKVSEESDMADGTIKRECMLPGCHMFFTGPLENVHQECRDHIKSHHSLDCHWVGCKCTAKRQDRCAGRPSGHKAHVTDIARHYLSHFDLPPLIRK